MKNDRKTIFGWALYDWANSSYATVVLGAVLPAYFADEIVPEGGWHGYDGQTIWALTAGALSLLLFILMPVLGAMADFSSAKLRFLQVFAYGGSVFTIILFFATTGQVVFTLLMVIVAQFGFVGGNVFYNGFLPDISTPETIDRVSSKGFAYGYLGGGLYLGFALMLIQASSDQALAARYSIAGAGIWWAVFSFFAFLHLKETGTGLALPSEYQQIFRPWAYVRIGLSRTWASTRKLWGFKQVLLFVVAYILYNDGVQTTIGLAGVYASDTLELETADIAVAFLLVQFVAFGGTWLFNHLAHWLNIKRAIQINLLIWIGMVVVAYFVPAGRFLPFLSVALVSGVVLGGIQALSRSLYGSMIPEENSAEMFGFYSVFQKFSAIWGPLFFGIVSGVTSSGRAAILTIIPFLALGLLLFSRVKVDEARLARNMWIQDDRTKPPDISPLPPSSPWKVKE